GRGGLVGPAYPAGQAGSRPAYTSQIALRQATPLAVLAGGQSRRLSWICHDLNSAFAAWESMRPPPSRARCPAARSIPDGVPATGSGRAWMWPSRVDSSAGSADALGGV